MITREIREETGLNAKIAKKGKLIKVHDRKKGKNWVVKVFLCKVSSNKVKLCSENTDFAWINHKELKKYKTVPGLKKDLKVLGLI